MSTKKKTSTEIKTEIAEEYAIYVKNGRISDVIAALEKVLMFYGDTPVKLVNGDPLIVSPEPLIGIAKMEMDGETCTFIGNDEVTKK
jgi:hypothetical protein